MTRFDQTNLEKLRKSLKYQLKHKIASLLTQQQILEKSQNEKAEKSKSGNIAKNKNTVQPALNSAI